MVINTLKSRCQIFHVPRIDNSSLVHYLTHEHDLEVDRAEQMAYLSEGNMGLVLEYLAIDNNQIYDLSIEWLSICSTLEPVKLRNWVERFDQYNLEEKKAILSYFMKILREVIHYRLFGSQGVRLGVRELERLMEEEVFQKITVDQIHKISLIVSESVFYLERNAHAKILLFNSLLEIESVLNKRVHTKVNV